MNSTSAISERSTRQGPFLGDPLAFARGWFLFVREALANPREIGAVIPSSPALARRMAAEVSFQGGETVIELGAGTGAVTEALLSRGIPPRQIIAIERSPALAELLRERFPKVQIVCGDAAELRRHLRRQVAGSGARSATPASVQVVSSLPLRSLPAPKVKEILHEIHLAIRGHGRWIQYTYALTQRRLPASFRLLHSHVVWQNVPPARIDVFTAGQSQH